MNRVKVEDRLMGLFSEIASYDPKEHETIDGFKDGTYGVSSLSLGLYATGLTERGPSPERPMGLWYHDGSNFFGIGFFENRLYFVAPRGPDVVNAANSVATEIRSDSQLGNFPIYLRHLTYDLMTEFKESGWLDIDENPWHPKAEQEDETYSAGLVTVSEVIEETDRGLEVKVLRGSESKNFRHKNRYSHNAFRNFLERNGLKVVLVPYDGSHHESAEFIINTHFALLEREGKAFGSYPDDYNNIINSKILESLGDQAIAYVGYLRKKDSGQEVPVMLYVGERLSDEIVGLYAEFALRDNGVILPAVDVSPSGLGARGFRRSISTYGYLSMFNILRNLGFEKVHLGGSETVDLDRFKRELGGNSDPSYWVVDRK